MRTVGMVSFRRGFRVDLRQGPWQGRTFLMLVPSPFGQQRHSVGEVGRISRPARVPILVSCIGKVHFLTVD
jgi:hypothetical protein